jgi:hypothetical protein
VERSRKKWRLRNDLFVDVNGAVSPLADITVFYPPLENDALKSADIGFDVAIVTGFDLSALGLQTYLPVVSTVENLPWRPPEGKTTIEDYEFPFHFCTDESGQGRDPARSQFVYTVRSRLHEPGIIVHGHHDFLGLCRYEVLHNNPTKGGDSGGPLIDDRGVLVGIHRSGGPRHLLGRANVATRLDYFLRDGFHFKSVYSSNNLLVGHALALVQLQFPRTHVDDVETI